MDLYYRGRYLPEILVSGATERVKGALLKVRYDHSINYLSDMLNVFTEILPVTPDEEIIKLHGLRANFFEKISRTHHYKKLVISNDNLAQNIFENLTGLLFVNLQEMLKPEGLLVDESTLCQDLVVWPTINIVNEIVATWPIDCNLVSMFLGKSFVSNALELVLSPSFSERMKVSGMIEETIALLSEPGYNSELGAYVGIVITSLKDLLSKISNSYPLRTTALSTVLELTLACIPKAEPELFKIIAEIGFFTDNWLFEKSKLHQLEIPTDELVETFVASLKWLQNNGHFEKVQKKVKEHVFNIESNKNSPKIYPQVLVLFESIGSGLVAKELFGPCLANILKASEASNNFKLKTELTAYFGRVLSKISQRRNELEYISFATSLYRELSLWIVEQREESSLLFGLLTRFWKDLFSEKKMLFKMIERHMPKEEYNELRSKVRAKLASLGNHR